MDSQYIVQEEIGKGAFSTVFRVTHRATNVDYALKVIDKKGANMDPRVQKRLATEVQILKRVNHPHIIPLRDLFDTPDKLYLIMELVDGGELFDKIVEKGFYSERDAQQVVRNVITALQYLHSNNIIHRDLKPENLLLKKGNDTHVLISDFGLSRILGEGSMASTACGTPYYVAPEVLKAQGYNKEVDMWSIGVVTYFMLAGFPPFMGDNLPEIVDLIVNGDYDYPSPYWDQVSAEAKDFVGRLLVVDPSKRMTAVEALQHPWLSGSSASDRPLNNSRMAEQNELRKQKNTPDNNNNK